MMSKAVLITGASTGLGRAIAEDLSGRGFQVYAFARAEKDLQALSKIQNVKTMKLDVTSDTDCAHAAMTLASDLSQFKTVHLINNAGISVPGPIEGIPVDEFRRQLDVNVLGVVRSTQAFLPWVRKTKGRVINMSSISGLTAAPFLGAYSASKFAVEALSDSMRRELLPFGVRVVLIEPGPIQTPIWEKGLSNKDKILGGLRPGILEVYKTKLQEFLTYVEATAKRAAPVERVTQAAFHALTAPTPRIRYIVGRRGLSFAIRLMLILPTSVLDKIMSGRIRPI